MTVKKNAKGKKASENGKAIEARYAADGKRVVAAYKKHGGDWTKIAKATEMSELKARRMYARATLKESERLWEKGLSNAAMGKEIRRLVDAEGMSILPDVWARTGLSVKRIKELYAAKPKPRRKTGA